MPARITIERVLRDDDDASGQSIRSWKIECDAGFVTIKMNHGSGFIILRPADVEIFKFDLSRAASTAGDMEAEK